MMKLINHCQSFITIILTIGSIVILNLISFLLGLYITYNFSGASTQVWIIFVLVIIVASLLILVETIAVIRLSNKDIERKVVNRTKELERTQAERILQLYQFAAFGRMASGVFHDLANPLTTVTLSLEGLKDDLPTDDLTRAIEGTQRMKRFIEAARHQFQHQELNTIFNLREEIAQSVAIINYKSEKSRVRVIADIPTELEAYGNPIKFQQIITNLVGNAIDSYEKVSNHWLNRKVFIEAVQRGRLVIITVKDRGSGISKQDQVKIFQPFFTTKSPNEGTGIGLSITKDFAEIDFGGQLTVASKEGEGTKFTFIFPRP